MYLTPEQIAHANTPLRKINKHISELPGFLDRPEGKICVWIRHDRRTHTIRVLVDGRDLAINSEERAGVEGMFAHFGFPASYTNETV